MGRGAGRSPLAAREVAVFTTAEPRATKGITAVARHLARTTTTDARPALESGTSADQFPSWSADEWIPEPCASILLTGVLAQGSRLRLAQASPAACTGLRTECGQAFKNRYCGLEWFAMRHATCCLLATIVGIGTTTGTVHARQSSNELTPALASHELPAFVGDLASVRARIDSGVAQRDPQLLNKALDLLVPTLLKRDALAEAWYLAGRARYQLAILGVVAHTRDRGLIGCPTRNAQRWRCAKRSNAIQITLSPQPCLPTVGFELSPISAVTMTRRRFEALHL